MKKTIVALALAAAGFAANAQPAVVDDNLIEAWKNGIPTSTLAGLASGDLIYQGTGAEDLRMTQIEGNASGAVHNESPMINGYGHKLTIDNINNLTITGLGDKATEQTKTWNSAIYTNSTVESAISINAKGKVEVTGASIGVHALTGSVDITAANIEVSGGNAVVAQQAGQVTLTAYDTIMLKGTSSTVNAKDFGSDHTNKHTIKLTAPTIQIETTANTEGSAALRVDGTGTAALTGTDITIASPKNALLVTEGGTLTVGTLTTTRAAEGMVNLNLVGSVDVDGTMNLTSDAAVSVEGEGATATIANLSAENKNVDFTFDHFAAEGQVLSITANNASSTDVVFTADAVDGLDADEVADKMATNVGIGAGAKGTVTGAGTNFTVSGEVGANGRLDADSVTVAASEITNQTADLAVMSLVAWRNETTTITDRLASLRGNTADMGAWVRWNGGEYQYDDRNLSNDFNTIEVGGDVKVAPNWIVGASLSYTKGDGDFAHGETDSDAYAGALYALWTHDSGSFVDMVAKTGRISTDFDFRNAQGGARDDGTLDQTGFILSVETGHRFALPANTFVEPQIQLQYSRLSSVSETTAVRHVELDSSNSFIGRIGVMAGLECPNDMGTVWMKVSALRDFKGDIDGVSANADGSSPYAFSEELDQSWGELALGADFKVTDNVYTFVDAQKSFGGDIELDWRANVGARFVW